MRIFNTEGPIDPAKHYFVPHRLDEIQMNQLIDLQKYFILHAPRQSGKTTAITMFTKQLNDQGKYKALYFNIEPAQAMRSNVIEGMKIILDVIYDAGKLFMENDEQLFKIIDKNLKKISGNSLASVLQQWSTHSDKPILLFIDEIDSLVGDTLISVLRQLRAGYIKRPKNFPQSVCLVGVRDVRDYRIWSDEEQQTILGGSAFNIKAESLVLPDFSLAQVRNLYLQHTQETGQQFTDEAIEYAYFLTQGQPWLVNALAYQACFRDVTDLSITITKEIIERSKETLILRRDTHLDVLFDRLQEPRVRDIIDAILNGDMENLNVSIDDIQYVIDLGLISKKEKTLTIANPIYQEIIPRELSLVLQRTIVQNTIWYQNPDNSLNMQKLMESFQQFYRQHSEIWIERNIYKESAPHIIMMAFLQRIINGGGKIHREYAFGRRRLDIFIEWPFGKNIQRIVIELKIWRSEKTIIEGLQQTAEYMDLSGATQGHLVVVNRDPTIPWEDKIFSETRTVDKYSISVWGI